MAYTTNCLTDFIGLLGCSTTTPDSGLYVNTLPGISLKSVDHTADSEQVTFAGVWSDVQKRATRKIFTDIKAELSKRYQLKNITEAVDIGKKLESDTTTAAAKYRGLLILLDNFSSSDKFVTSNFQQINVQLIRIYMPTTQNTTLKIFDAITGEQLKSQAVTGTAGWNDIEIYEKYTARKIFVAYDSTNIIGTKIDIENTGCCEYTDCKTIIYGGESAIASTVKDASITRGFDSFGLSVVYDIQCTYDSFVCNHKEVFTNALWYLLGAELMFELQYSPRINFYTTINAQKAKDLREEFTMIYKEELSQALSGINLNISDCCIECNNQVIIKESCL